ncbi:M48 family metallopeptidase [Motiliproteus sp.]|uniref:M48 family metallopeptidase n=1 Tax=Motiliproteus sp. TaxID=1898955 RepID=UPI003BA9A75C
MSTPTLPFDWEVKFTRRRGSIALQVHPDRVRVLAPKGTAQREIRQLLLQRRDWLEAALLKHQQYPSQTKCYQDGESWLIEGRPHRLELELDLTADSQASPNVRRLDQRLILQLSPAQDGPEQRAQALRGWYQQQAEAHWPERIDHWVTITGLEPSSLKIRPYKSRWGSCTQDGRISLNTLLVMAPPEVLDYVIIHELCHLRHLNHSQAYWDLVARFCDQPKQYRQWLRRHSEQLRF